MEHTPAYTVFPSTPKVVTRQEVILFEQCDPCLLLDKLIAEMHLENDAALARALQLHTRIIEMLRERKLFLTSTLLMAICEAAGMSVQELLNLKPGQ